MQERASFTAATMSRAVQFPSNVSMFNPAPFPPIDRKITSIREHEGDFTSNQQASYEFLSYLFIPLEYSTFLYIYIFLGKIDRLTGSTNCRKRGKTRQVGNNPCEGGHKYRLGGGQKALGVFGIRGLWRYRNNRWPRFATVTPRKPRNVSRLPSWFMDKKNGGGRLSLPLRGGGRDARAERKMIHGPFADSTRRAAAPLLRFPLLRALPPFYLQYPRGKGGLS